MQNSSARTNRLAIFSLLSAVLTITSFCVGAVPIPFTAWVCFPGAIVLSLVSIITGSIALRQIRLTAEKGRRLALTSIVIAILTLLFMLIFTALSALILYYGVQALNGFWAHFKP